MDIIDNYLETMFSRYPQTQRTLEAKAELRSMMEDAYNGALSAGRSPHEAIGQAITEFGNLDEIAPLLDFEREGTAAAAAPSAGQAPVGSITLAQAGNFAEATRRTRGLLTTAIVLFILSPIPLISLTVLSGNPRFPMESDIASMIGLAALLPLVGIGVAMLVWRSSKLEPFTRITEGQDAPSPAVVEWAKSLRNQHSGQRSLALVIATVIWILSALPVIISGLLADTVAIWGDELSAIGLPTTLIMVAIGMAIFLPNNWAYSVAETLIDTADTVREEYEAPPPIRAILAGYWPIMVIAYLAWSFIGDAWHISWVLWPIAGISYGAIFAMIFAWRTTTKS